MKIALVRRVDLGEFPLVDPVRIRDDFRAFRLAEDLGQPRDSDRFRTDQIAQHGSRPDARQLIDISHKQDPRSARDRPQQMESSGVSIMLASSMISRSQSSGLSLPRLKPPEAKVHLQQSMDREGLFSRDLRHPFGSPSRRRCQQDLIGQFFGDGQNRFRDRAFSRSGTAGDDMDLIGQRLDHRLFLLLGELDLQLLLDPVDRLCGIDRADRLLAPP